METLNYPADEDAKRDIVEAGRRLYARGLVAGNDGNISARVSDTELWTTPSGVSKGFMTGDMLIKMDIYGNVLEGGGGRKPSSEVKLHLRIYGRSRGVLAVCHAHPPVATSFAAAGIPLDRALLQEAVVLLGVIPLAEYAPPGSDELADGAARFCPDYNGALLEHHGAVSWGGDVMGALYRLESIEYNATVAMYSRLMGVERPMSESQIDGLLLLRPAWGVTGGGRPAGRPEEDARR
ncbi:MAG: class II aldolase/adducin family protein [Oscillospiraceae bacterium]|nr:class II aldolase/adducin family protein [Oscillospiraceae bacterium]